MARKNNSIIAIMASHSVSFHLHEVHFRLNKKKEIRFWLHAVLNRENIASSSISYIFCNDRYLLKLNKQYLGHQTLTDVISFDYSNSASISGEVYISLERVKENAVKYQVSLNDEIQRVMIHGLLHLAGYKDKTASEKTTMREKEDYYLSLRPHTLL